jgi:PAS domain S-box-containing protein
MSTNRPTNPVVSQYATSDRLSAERIHKQYIVTLGLVACLTIANQALLRQSLDIKRSETAVVDLLNRAIVGGQQLAKMTLEMESAIVEGGTGANVQPFLQALDQFSEAFRSLPKELELAGVPAESIAPLAQGDPSLQSLFDTSQALVRLAQDRTYPDRDRGAAHRAAAQAILQANALADQASRIVAACRQQLAERKRVLDWIGLCLVSVTLAVLLVQASLIVRRAMRMLRRFFDREGEWMDAVKAVTNEAERMASELHRQELDLRNLALVATNTDSLVLITDAQGRIEWVNRSFARATGYSLAEVVGKDAEMILDGVEDPAKVRQPRPWLRGNASFTGEIVIQSKTGISHWLEVDAQPTLDENGRLRNHIMIGMDVSERKAALRELERLSRQNELILNSTAEAICGVDLEGNITFVNAAMTRTLGCEATSLLGKPLHETLRHSQTDGTLYSLAACPLCSAIRTGRSYHAKDASFWKKDGTNFPVEYTTTPIVENGKKIGTVVTFRDITAENLLQSQLMQAHKLEAIGQLAAGIAHEINTPIQYVGDNTRFLQEAFENLCRVAARESAVSSPSGAATESGTPRALAGPASEDAELEYLVHEVPIAIEQSLEGIERVTKIVRAMKEFSHPGNGRKVAIDLRQAIENTITIARNEWKYVADVVTEFDGSIPLLTCLPGELNQALLNILVNAAHAIGEATANGAKGKGKIIVSTRRDGDWVEIRIRDTGNGIPERFRRKVFEPFFTTKPVGKGTGQGLTVAYAVVVEQHGGTIDFETEEGRGTTFIIRLPLVPERATDGGEQVEEACAVC